MRFTTTILYLAACLAAPATARSILSRPSAPGEDHKIEGDSPMYHCVGDFSDDLLEISKIDISPNPPQSGHDLVISASGFLAQTIGEGSYVEVEVKMGLVKLLKQTVDLCEQAGNVDLKCPIEEGPVVLNKTVEIPRAVPPARFTVTANVFSEDDEPVTCLWAVADFNPNHRLGALEDNEDL